MPSAGAGRESNDGDASLSDCSGGDRQRDQPSPSETRRQSLKQSDGELTLTIKDHGRGFSRASIAIEGMGLRIMEYRADMIGAMIRVDSTVGKGTTVACRLKGG